MVVLNQIHLYNFTQDTQQSLAPLTKVMARAVPWLLPEWASLSTQPRKLPRALSNGPSLETHSHPRWENSWSLTLLGTHHQHTCRKMANSVGEGGAGNWNTQVSVPSTLSPGQKGPNLKMPPKKQLAHLFGNELQHWSHRENSTIPCPSQ